MSNQPRRFPVHLSDLVEVAAGPGDKPGRACGPAESFVRAHAWVRYQATVSVIAVASGVVAVPKADSNFVVSRTKGSSNS